MKKIEKKQIERLVFINRDEKNGEVSALLPVELVGEEKMLTVYPTEQIEASILYKGHKIDVRTVFDEVVERLYTDLTKKPQKDKKTDIVDAKHILHYGRAKKGRYGDGKEYFEVSCRWNDVVYTVATFPQNVIWNAVSTLGISAGTAALYFAAVAQEEWWLTD